MKTTRIRRGGWLPYDLSRIDSWIRELKQRAEENPRDLIAPIQSFKDMVYQDPVLSGNVNSMFADAWVQRKKTPLGTPEVRSFDEFLVLLNQIMHEAPEYTVCPDDKDPMDPCGLVGFPINALLNWPMGTAWGYDVFSNQLVHQQFKKILAHWSAFLITPESRYVLVESHTHRVPKVLAWLSEPAKREMVEVACQATENADDCESKSFSDIFVCNPDDQYYGFHSWDDFFTRVFREGLRPVADPGDWDIISNACESSPLQTPQTDVQASAQFWLKSQPYSLLDMMNFDLLAEQFVGGTVYQAFLSALSYHRWNSPVSGRVRKAFVVNGSYYLENRYEGFLNHGDADPSAPNDSQAFLTAVATRAVIFIEADNPKIGLMCFIAVGMAEVSSCEITVSEGQHLDKGEQLGMFHFGGSTHCLVFRPEVNLEFDERIDKILKEGNEVNIPVRSKIARVF